MRALVTGGAGFIGSALVRYLVRDVGAEVLNIDKLTYAGNPASLTAVHNAPNYRFLKADICNRATLAHAFVDFRPDTVMHLAAESHVDRSLTGAAAFIEPTSTEPLRYSRRRTTYFSDLSDDEKERFRFLQVSTDEVYGSLGEHDGLFAETTAYDPSSPYSASKAASDHLALAWFRTYGLPVIVSNCSNNYGPFQFPEKLIPLVILNAFEGKPLPVYGNGSNVRDWLYVEDHVHALHLIATRGRLGEKYNIGGRNERRNIAVVEQICKIMDQLHPKEAPHARLIRFVADRPGHDARYALDATQAGKRARLEGGGEFRYRHRKVGALVSRE